MSYQMQMPERVLIEQTSSDNHGRFILQPLEQGYGVTIGNAFRRVLLSSIPGSAITGVKFTNVLHEFQTIPGVTEDVAEIILNLKEVRFKLIDKKAQRIAFRLKGPGEWTARDIQEATSQIEVVNLDHHIATLEDLADFDVELRVGRGKGYVPSEEQPSFDFPVGMLPIDSIFTPIQNVIYTVEPFRVGQKTDYE
ncbi:MAG TPA: DNA-directed RNA polymerase subunit alpha, partial [Candidatus Kapabacteria bacterium]|nr:DNA-directed RNA polymerase subunit alpha [Candidatus Kapabacteria bacterium]